QASFFKPLAAISQVLGSVDLNDASLLANLSLITGSDQEASEVVSFINNGLALVKLALGSSPEASPLLNMLNGITGSQAGNAANLIVNLPTDLIRTLFDQIKSKAPKG
ncbi:MAG TPA: hypothetical protein VLD57_11305, partial [Blastocatellia bacterium]|nr:hypothetical protein [Blastocatellia bacterium]